MIALTQNPIDTQAVLSQVESPRAGAVLLFLGTVRQFTADRETASLDYECYPEMAEKQLARLEDEARRRWSLVDCVLVHRLGHMRLGEASVAVAVSAAHRNHAFEAGQWLIDTLKEVVPIWKKENWADGTTQWVHPSGDSPEVPLSETQSTRCNFEVEAPEICDTATSVAETSEAESPVGEEVHSEALDPERGDLDADASSDLNTLSRTSEDH
jgi:molybdopterin synthase catalytic subunit